MVPTNIFGAFDGQQLYELDKWAHLAPQLQLRSKSALRDYL